MRSPQTGYDVGAAGVGFAALLTSLATKAGTKAPSVLVFGEEIEFNQSECCDQCDEFGKVQR